MLISMGAALILQFSPATPEPMAALVAQRLARLDKLVLHVTHSMYGVPDTASPLDRNHWLALGSFPHRITIVRPNVLHEFLHDDPKAGYVPTVASVFDGNFTQRHVRPAPSGRTFFTVVANEVACGALGWAPLLQVFDIHLHDSAVPQLNIARLFQEFGARRVRDAGDVCTFVAAVPMRGYTARYEFDLNRRGTPMRVKTTLEISAPPDTKPITWEQFVLATQEVNGAELPSETVIAVFNPNVQRFGTVHHFQVTSVEVRDNLTPEAIRIVPERKNAVVSEWPGDGTNLHRTYDAEGKMISEKRLFGGNPETVDKSVQFVPRDSLRWRMAVPPVALAFGSAIALGAHFFSRRAAR